MKQSASKGMVLLTVILMDFLAGMEFDLFIPSFPELQDQFSLTPFWVEALLSVNFIGCCVSLFIVGALADRFGRKPVIFLGLLTFIIGSSLCLTALSYPFLLIGRFLQGVGIAAPMILSFLIIADSYPLKKQQFYMAMLNGLMNASVAAAPVIGSYITKYYHWQGNFTALLLLSLTTLMMVTLYIPAHKKTNSKEMNTLTGYITIFKTKPLILMIITFIFLFVPYWIFVGMSPLLYMEELGVNLLHFGYYQGALAMVFAVGSFIYGFFINKFDQRRALYLSCVLLIIGIMMIAWVSVQNCTNPLLITLSILPFIIGQIIPVTILYPLCLNYISEAKGRVSAIIQGGYLVLAACGLQVAGYFYTGSIQNIGIIMIGMITISVILLFIVLKTPNLIHLDNPS